MQQAGQQHCCAVARPLFNILYAARRSTRAPHDAMKETNSLVFGVSAWLLLAGSITFGRQQDRDLSGIHGIPVEGHDIVGGVEIIGTKQLASSRSGWDKLRERLAANGADLRLGWPLESQTLCRFKEVVLDVMSEKGFRDAEISLDTRPTYGNRRHLTLKFTITEGKRSRPIARAAPLLSPAQRCSR